MTNRPLALITGASSGIGAALADCLADEGYDLVLVARRGNRLEAAATALRACGAAVQTLVADLATSPGIERVVTRIGIGDVQLLVANAGAGGYAPLADVGAAETEQLWTLNATAPLLLIRAALPHLLARDEGGIITVASLLAFSAGQNAQYLPHRTIYASAKAATVALTRTLSTELADTKVRAMVVCPGRVQTDFADAAAQNDSQAMTAADVVTATWTAYNRGDTICVPALATSTEIDALTQAEAALLANGNKPTVADTYVVVRRVGADADGL